VNTVTHLGPSFLRKIKIAIPNLEKQMAQWHEMSAGIDQQQVSDWLAEVVAWENDSSQPNPFQSRSTSMFSFSGVSYFRLI
jgi:hypothetical protein